MGLPLLHSVLVTQPVSQAAMARLHIFFDVETQFGNPLPGSDALVQWLHGKAGVIADTRYRFDAALLVRLPAGGRAWLFRRFPGRALRLLLQ